MYMVGYQTSGIRQASLAHSWVCAVIYLKLFVVDGMLESRLKDTHCSGHIVVCIGIGVILHC